MARSIKPKYLPDWDKQIPWMWKPRDYQSEAWNYLATGGKRMTIIWHRRAGKDLFSLQWLIRSCVLRPGTYWHVFPNYSQGKKSIWYGRTKHTTPEIRYLDYIPIEVRNAKNGGNGINDAELTVTFHPDLGGSIYQIIGADKPEALVGAGVSGVIYSEYDLMPPSTHMMLQPMLKESDGWAIFCYTPHGRNHGYDHWNRVKRLEQKEHYTQLLTVEDTQKYTGWDLEELVEEARNEGFSEEKIQSEYWCSFDAPAEGSIFGQQLIELDKKGYIGKYEWDPDYPVFTCWDWGFDDHTAIWFFQVFEEKVIFIDYYEDRLKGIDHYARVLKNRPYVYETHYVPHDMRQHESTGITRIDNARRFGLRLHPVPRLPKTEQVEAGRALLRRVRFDDALCSEGLGCLRSYKREYDHKMNRFKDNPEHDDASHGSDAFMLGGIAMRFWQNKQKKKRPKSYLQETAYKLKV